MSTENLRRSSRLKVRKPKRYMSSNSDENLDDNPVNTVEDELRDVEENVQKPVELFSSDDVSGQALYKFQTPSRKDAMTKKAHLCRTPINDVLLPIAKVVLEKINVYNKEQPKTSKKDQKISKIPVIQRKYEFGLTSSESESISESSDYHPVEDTEETTDSEDVVSSNDEKDQMKIRNQKQKFISQSHLLNTPKRVTRKNKPSIIHKDFHMQTDEYFATQSEKVVTSDRTLEHLRNSRLTKEKLEKLLTNQSHVSLQHKKNIYSVTSNYSTLFPMWYFIMEQGYTVLLYGLGSKRCLINDFYKSISYHPSLVVNGFFPSLTMKDILDGIIIDLLELNCPSNTTECIDLIEKTLRKNPKDRLYLLIHNIDASVDHINAPLLWDHTKHSKFKFFWWDTTTFLSYQEETSYESSLLVKQSGALALSSLHNVFLSLTSNAKSIYLLLVKNQLSNSNNVNFTGMAFKDLYRAAREGFLVSSDLALRAQLTEFIDHKLVKIKRNIDSIEHLIIPLSSGLLKQFLEEHDT
ncbi:origin recognition complex subunit 2 isoform X2 [Bombus vosnesenskii]|uniref:Origin recognition complex subunit 2 n=1 Tax=Bombus vosnesenskii TaxID=207650 RepID=A0A6J3JTY9_9HYME|nr:origin recognition complex subunit 2 isoform X2 [Bombus vosnesenskii]